MFVVLLVLCFVVMGCGYFLFFFFNDTATTEIYTLSLHDALPIWGLGFGGLSLRVLGVIGGLYVHTCLKFTH